MSKWKARYPCLNACLDAITEIVAQLRDAPDAELEARFGVVGENRRFVSGVSRAEIDRIIDMMQASSHVSGDQEWTEEQDFFFTLNGTQYRTRVTYDSDAMKVGARTIEKKNVASRDVQIFRSDASRHHLDMRVSLKLETPVLRLQPCVNTDMVRIKQRRRFVTSCGRWAFDFSIIWSGTNKTAAETAQATCDPTFEIECELIDAAQMLATQDDARIASSLLLKMQDLLSQDECTFRPL